MGLNKKIISAILIPPLLIGVFFYFASVKNSGLRYDFLAKRIQIDNPNEAKINFSELRKILTEFIQSNNQYSNQVGLYFEYLPTGVSININEKNEAVGASLMKLPFVMNIYKAAELNKITLDKEITIKKEWLNSDYGTLYKKGEGYRTTLKELAKLTLKDSDNTALLAIADTYKSLNLNVDAQSLNYLDVEYNSYNEGKEVMIGSRSYSSILKCLYFSCFNTKEDSNEILEYLTQSSFNDRLTMYLPENMLVAHKIGTYSRSYQSDCGIFYMDRKNYILCVMVNGDDPGASKIIAELSQKTYLFMLNN